MTLLDFLDRVYLLERDLAASSEYQFRRSVCMLQEYAGRELTTHCLTADLLNAFIRDRLKVLAAKTVAKVRGDVLCLWRMAYEHSEHAEYPRRVRKVKVPRKVPSAFSQEQLRAVVEAAALIGGAYEGGTIPRGLWWNAFLRTAFDTGLRRSDLLALRRAQIGAGGVLAVPIAKLNGSEHVCRVRPSTLAAIEATFPPARSLLFPWSMTKRMFFLHFHKICNLAGISSTKGLGMHQVRRTGATFIEAHQPGIAGRFLGHLTPGLAERHYIDPRIRLEAIPLPPDLIGDTGKDGAI